MTIAGGVQCSFARTTYEAHASLLSAELLIAPRFGRPCALQAIEAIEDTHE